MTWGDGSPAQPVTTPGQQLSGVYFLADHTYHAKKTQTYSITASPVSVTGNCTIGPGSYTFTLDVGNCPSVLFLGAHGVNEGSRTNWGNNVKAMWDAFHKKVPAAVGKAVNYPYIKLKWPADFSTIKQAVTLKQSTAEPDAHILETDMFNQFTTCSTRTRFVLAGMSLGAWVVDLALRDLNGTVAGKLILAQVAGVGLMGDPAFPKHICKTVTGRHGSRRVCRQGVATYFGQGYSKQSDYLDNGLSRGFISLCLSYSDTYLDPVCGMYDLGSFTKANIALHGSGYQNKSGAAAYLGGVLAGYVKQ
jgi:hypothetical protein